MTISEPTTLVTDYVVAGGALVFWWRLRRSARATDARSRAWWSHAFLATAVAALAGGTSHGFAPGLGDLGWLVLLKLTIYALAVASLCLLMGSLTTVFQGLWWTALGAAVWTKLGLYALLMTQRNDFDLVIYEYGSSMLAVLLLALWSGWRHRAPATGWIVAALLVSFVAARIQRSGFELHRNFNHNDLYHVVQLVGLYLLYRAGLLLRDADATYQRS